jgi:RecA/RadA recombinase
VRQRGKAVEAADPISAGSAPPPLRKAIPLPKGWERASDALDTITSVRTIFPDFNRKVRVGGLPVRRIHTVHGPTHGGKTAFVLGLLRSFADGGHIAALVDAEHASGKEFVSELVGDLEAMPNFIAKRPSSYEDTIDAVDGFLAYVKEAKRDQPGLRSICVVDSINKLVPRRELEKILSKGGSDELAKGHWGRYRAALNQTWLDHLVPMLSGADCALVLIAQEREEDAENSWGAAQVKIKGGAALMFDSSLLIRVSKSKPMFEPSEPKEENIVGFMHKVRIHKSKVSHMDGRHTDCLFHLSNGRITPAGFDLARDTLHVGKQLNVVVASGSWLTWKKRRWQGEARALAWLAQNNGALVELVADVHGAVDRDAGRAG